MSGPDAGTSVRGPDARTSVHGPDAAGAGASTADATAANASATASAISLQQNHSSALGATAALLALIVLSVVWEGWLAPLRPGGSALVLKALPLLIALPGVWRRRLYTQQWASMLILLYFAEGIVRGWSDHGLSARLGWLETALSVVFFVCTLAYVAPFKRAAKQAAKQAANQAAKQATEQAAEQPAKHAARQAVQQTTRQQPPPGAE